MKRQRFDKQCVPLFNMPLVCVVSQINPKGVNYGHLLWPCRDKNVQIVYAVSGNMNDSVIYEVKLGKQG